MDRRRILRLLRIAFSIVCGIVCLLLIVFWLRSHRYYEVFEIKTDSRLVQVRSWHNRLELWQFAPSGARVDSSTVRNFVKEISNGRFFQSGPITTKRHFAWDTARFQLVNQPWSTTLFVPHWFPVVGFAACAAVPWIAWSTRFSLRTLLLTTTLAALFLGAVVYAIR